MSTTTKVGAPKGPLPRPSRSLRNPFVNSTKFYMGWFGNALGIVAMLAGFGLIWKRLQRDEEEFLSFDTEKLYQTQKKAAIFPSWDYWGRRRRQADE